MEKGVDHALYCPVGSWVAKYAIRSSTVGHKGRFYQVGSFSLDDGRQVKGLIFTMEDGTRIGLSSQVSPDSLRSGGAGRYVDEVQDALCLDLELLAQCVVTPTATDVAIEMRRQSLKDAFERFQKVVDEWMALSPGGIEREVDSVSVLAGSAMSQRSMTIMAPGQDVGMRDVSTGASYAVTTGVWNQAAQDAMSKGQCIGYAAALNECFDVPIVGIYESPANGPRRLVHVAVQFGDDEFYDALGNATAAEFLNCGLENVSIEPILNEQMHDLLRGIDQGIQLGQVQRMAAIRTFLAPSLEANGRPEQAAVARDFYSGLPFAKDSGFGL